MYIISGCLCGINCKYNGLNNLDNNCLDLLKSGQAILVCPEQLGGLSTPRVPAEISSKDKENIKSEKFRVITKDNKDVTQEFIKGAYETLKIAKEIGVEKAILKDGSPSCGTNFIYDGTFSGKKIKGMGVTARLLIENGIDVISDKDFGGLDNEFTRDI